MQLLLHKIWFSQLELRELLENGQLESCLPDYPLTLKEIFTKNQYGTLLQTKKGVYYYLQVLIKLINFFDGPSILCKRYGQTILLILLPQVSIGLAKINLFLAQFKSQKLPFTIYKQQAIFQNWRFSPEVLISKPTKFVITPNKRWSLQLMTITALDSSILILVNITL